MLFPWLFLTRFVELKILAELLERVALVPLLALVSFPLPVVFSWQDPRFDPLFLEQIQG